MENQTYTIVKDILMFILTFTGLIIAGMGLFTWRKQIKGKKNFDTAHNLHLSLLKARDAIKYVRNPAIWNDEFDKATKYYKNKYPEKTIGEIEENSKSYVYEMRWDKVIEATREMEALALSAEVLWGPEILDKISLFRKKINELNIKLSQYINPQLRTGNLADLQDYIFDTSTEEEKDKFSKEIDKEIKNVTDYIKKKYK